MLNKFMSAAARRTAAATVAGIAAIGVSFAVPTAAQAAPSCSGWSHDRNGDGTGIMRGTHNLKSGPYAACGNRGSARGGARVWFHCVVENEYGNLWWWVRIDGTNTHGWMSQDNLTDIEYHDDNGDGEEVSYWC